MLVAIVGPDGCGKTTVAGYVKRRCRELGFASATMYECNFGILPKLGDLRTRLKCRTTNDSSDFVRKDQAESEFLSGMRIAPTRPFRALVLFFWYSLDYVLGHIVVEKAKREHRLLIFGRYYHDFLFQRAHRNVPAFLVRMVGRIVPQPDVIVLLLASPQIIFDRKPELSTPEILFQTETILSELSCQKNFHSVRSDVDLNTTINDVVQIIRRARGG